MTAKLESSADAHGDGHEGPTPIRSIRMTDADWATIKRAADKRGYGSASEFIRATVLKEIRTKR